MFQRSISLLLVPCLVMAVSLRLDAAPPEAAGARLATFNDATGDVYYALSLAPPLPGSTAAATDVVLLFDTSASQTGIYRDDALAACRALLSHLAPENRTHLMAIDLDPVALTDTLVAPQGSAMETAMAALERRVPLGSTDLAAGLRAAVSALAPGAGRQRAVIYVGDGISRANLLEDSELKELISLLVESQVSVSSFAVGPQRDVHLLATLANHTGGRVLVDADGRSSDESGLELAATAEAAVYWPVAVTMPTTIGEHFPQQMPPLRADRDSILVGKLTNREAGELQIELVTCGKQLTHTWQLTPEASLLDFVFLPRLVKEARENAGLRLATVGSEGLRETARVMMSGAEQLAELGSHALRTGDLEAARSAAEAALARDPSSPQAQALQSVVKRLSSSDEAPPAAEKPGELRLYPIQAPLQPPAESIDNVPSLAEEFEGRAGTILDAVETSRRVQSELIQAEVGAGLDAARTQMSVDPNAARQSLKILLEGIRRATDIDAEVRAQLVDRIQSAIREANRRSVEVENRRTLAEENRAAALEAERLLDQTARTRQRIKQLMERFNTLLDEGKYAEAEADIAFQVRDLDELEPTAMAALWNARNHRNVSEMERIRDLRHRNFVDALYWVENSSIPFPDEPPIVYPSAEVWEQITASRKKYASVDLAGRPGSAEERISTALNGETDFEYIELPLRDVIDDISFRHDIPIVVDTRALEDFGIGTDTPITMSLRGITLKSAMRLMLSEQDLTYVIQDEVLQITTPEEAESKLITKVYPVGDLVMPVGLLSSGGGGGGLGGGGGGFGGGGGGFGGGGGGFGGGGGGFGGGGGGFGGGGGGFGGGGGGFFAVNDDFSLKGEEQNQTTKPATTSPAATKRQPIKVDRRDGQSLEEAWDRHFAAHRDDSAADRVIHQARVRETIRVRKHEAQRALDNEQPVQSQQGFNEVVTIIQAELRHNQPQPWMYEAMSLAMLAGGAPISEVERALMSAVDFSSHIEEVLHVANYLTRLGLDARALKLFREVAAAEPFRPEPYMWGLAAAQKLGDEAGIRWAVVGILGQAWPYEHREIEAKARRVAETLFAKMLEEERREDAKQFASQLNEALQRDCIVRVSWTGDADVDLLVEEPTATVCSAQTLRTTAGGVLLGDVFAQKDEQTADGFSEIYVCPQGFTGQYRLLLRRIYGDVTAGKVTVEIVTNYGTEQQTYGKQQIPLGEKDAIVNFELAKGRRTAPLDEERVASVALARQEVGRAILAQQFAAEQDDTASRLFALALSRGIRSGVIDPSLIGRRGAVGFRPQITSFPEGNQMFGMAIISADRKYVRFELAAGVPIASGITNVDTFNFVTGGQGAGGAGGGGAGGGFGGGGFGGGGGGGGFGGGF